MQSRIGAPRRGLLRTGNVFVHVTVVVVVVHATSATAGISARRGRRDGNVNVRGDTLCGGSTGLKFIQKLGRVTTLHENPFDSSVERQTVQAPDP